MRIFPIDATKLFDEIQRTVPFSGQPPQQKGLWQRATEWLKEKAGRVFLQPQQTPAQAPIFAAMSGRTLRSPRMWHVNWEVLRRMQFTHAVHTIVGAAVRELSGLQWTIETTSNRRGVVKKAEEIKAFLRRPVPGVDGLTFPEWLKIILRDLFVYDAAAIEVIRDDNGAPLSLKPVPGWQIEARALPFSSELDPEEPYWRVHMGQVIAKYKPRELIYIKENHRSDSPYGISPLEVAFTIVTIILWMDAFNLKSISLSEVPEGILDLGQVPPQEVERFRLFWLQEVVGNPDKVIITNSGPGGIRWLPFRADNRSMQMRQMYDWYLRLLVACFGLRPQDIGLTEGLNRAIAEEMAYAGKRFGLWPRALLIKEVINHDILEEVFEVDLDDMQFKWLELERRDFEMTARIARTITPVFMTINEARTMLGLPRAVGPLVDALFLEGAGGAFVYGVVPTDDNKDLVDQLKEIQINAVGLYQGQPLGQAAGQPGGGLEDLLGALLGGGRQPEAAQAGGVMPAAQTPPTLPTGAAAEGTPAAEQPPTAPEEGPVVLWRQASNRTLPLEKVITLADIKYRLRKVPDGAWERLAEKMLAIRIPTRHIECLLRGAVVENDWGWREFLDLLAAAESEHGMDAMWKKVWLGVFEVDARKAVVNATDTAITIQLIGRRVEQQIEFPIRRDTNATQEA